MLCREAVALDPALIEPGREVRNQPSRGLHRSHCIPFGLHLLDKHLNERKKRTLLRLTARIPEYLSHHHLQSHHKAWLVMKLCRAKIVNNPCYSGAPDITRNIPEHGIVSPIPTSE